MKAPKQCCGMCVSGKRCSITSRSNLKDKFGNVVATTLQSSDYCLFHLELFRPVLLENNARVFYLDFETSGLSVSADNIVEIGLLESAGARFQTVVCPPVFVETPPPVHGISDQELREGPSFAEAFSRMCDFIENLLDMAVDEGGQRMVDPRPVALIAAHNGKKFDYPFLLSEVYKRNIDISILTTWLYCDTLDIARHCSVECCKLQCLFASCASSAGLHAHRALEDCVALQAVVTTLAERHGVTPLALLRRFAMELDPEAVILHIAALCG